MRAIDYKNLINSFLPIAYPEDIDIKAFKSIVMSRPMLRKGILTYLSHSKCIGLRCSPHQLRVF